MIAACVAVACAGLLYAAYALSVSEKRHASLVEASASREKEDESTIVALQVELAVAQAELAALRGEKREPPGPPTETTVAQAVSALGDVTRRVARLERDVARASPERQARTLALLSEARADLEEARRVLRQVVVQRENERCGFLALREADEAAMARDDERAIELYRKSIACDPHNSRIYSAWGHLLLRRGDVDGAIEKQRQAVEADPRFGVGHVYWAQALCRKGDVDGASSRLRQALAADPELRRLIEADVELREDCKAVLQTLNRQENQALPR